MKVGVYGLWHLGCVTAACLAECGHEVVGIDPDPSVIRDLEAGRPPLHEPGLPELIAAGHARGTLAWTTDARTALADVDALWITLDTPVNEHDEADPDVVRRAIDAVAGFLARGTLVVLSSQVPVGFTRAAALGSAAAGLHFACVPENLRVGRAIDSFLRPERLVAAAVDEQAKPMVNRLLEPLQTRVEWMSVESAEMTKHALNAFLATSVAFANELARVCERVGADAREVERGLRSDPRVGPKAYVSPGPAFAGGTLARDVRYLITFGDALQVATPLMRGVLDSNEAHLRAHFDRIRALLVNRSHPAAAVLGLTYKPGTSTLRRSASIELCRALAGSGITIRAYDPAIAVLPGDLMGTLTLCSSAADALDGADVGVIATAWPQFRDLAADTVVSAMRQAVIVDASAFLAGSLGSDPRIRYITTSRPVVSRG